MSSCCSICDKQEGLITVKFLDWKIKKYCPKHVVNGVFDLLEVPYHNELKVEKINDLFFEFKAVGE